jgi:hypothetical protein
MDHRIVCASILLVCGVSLAAQAQQGGGFRAVPVPTEFVLPVGMEPRLRTTEAVQGPAARVEGEDGGAHELRLKATCTWYEMTYVRVHDGRAVSNPPTQVPCWQLVPADSDSTDPYRWALWWPNGPTSTP